jgi:hypothetical protein
MTGQTNGPDRLWSIVSAGSKGYTPLLLACPLLAAACAKPAVHRDVSMDSLPLSMTSQAGDRHVLAGEWEYVDGAVVRLTLDEQGNGHYKWKGGRFQTHTRSSVIPDTACGSRKRMTEMVDLRSNSRQISQKGKGAGGSAASEPTMYPRKRAERLISPRRLLL